jgi:integrase
MKSKLISYNKEVGIITSDHDIMFHNKIRSATEGLYPFFEKRLLEETSRENADTVADYILALKTEINLSLGYKRINIAVLTKFCNILSQRNLRVVSRDEIISFLDSIRSSETSDPLHKWIGTYNLYRALLIRFFRWLYFPDMEQKKRPKPSVVENIPELKRKEKSIYKPTDLWTADDDLLFLKYCFNPRDRCYHAISRDLSCRPHEILSLHLKEIIFKTGGNYQYAEVLVNGKTGNRSIPLISSIPYLKDWMDVHPQRGNPNAFLIPTLGDRSYGKKMSSLTINGVYRRYKLRLFPKLLQDPSILPEDKQKLKELLKKPFNPYLRRHTGLTEKSKLLKENVLRQYAGWSGGSQMHLKYLHYFGNESSESLLEAYGLKSKAEEFDKLKPKQCSNCSEPNKIDSKFCAKCRMVLNYDAYQETVEDKTAKEDRLTTVEKQLQALMSAMGSMRESAKTELAQKLIQNGIYHP